jgi:hypothetical protein
MTATKWDGAVWVGNGKSGGSFTSGPFKIVLHTTETRGVPGYGYGATAPHVTYYPRLRRFYQHTEFDGAARALKNLSGGVQTNRDSVIQLEIVCYSDKRVADLYASSGALWVGDLSSGHLDDIRGFLQWTAAEFGIEWKWPGKQAYSSYGANRTGFRMAPAEWDAYNGIAAHQHVPENTHWDTGALDWGTLMGPTPPPPTEEDEDMFPKRGESSKVIEAYGWLLKAKGYPFYPPSEFYGGTMVAALKSMGFDGDEIGPEEYAAIHSGQKGDDGADGSHGLDGAEGVPGTVRVFVNGAEVN